MISSYTVSAPILASVLIGSDIARIGHSASHARLDRLEHGGGTVVSHKAVGLGRLEEVISNGLLVEPDMDETAESSCRFEESVVPLPLRSIPHALDFTV